MCNSERDITKLKTNVFDLYKQFVEAICVQTCKEDDQVPMMTPVRTQNTDQFWVDNFVIFSNDDSIKVVLLKWAWWILKNTLRTLLIMGINSTSSKNYGNSSYICLSSSNWIWLWWKDLLIKSNIWGIIMWD